MLLKLLLTFTVFIDIQNKSLQWIMTFDYDECGLKIIMIKCFYERCTSFLFLVTLVKKFLFKIQMSNTWFFLEFLRGFKNNILKLLDWLSIVLLTALKIVLDILQMFLKLNFIFWL